jgi:hypothetical protein
MRQLNTSLGFVAAASMLVLVSASANAQAARTWVSGVGDDFNPCSRTAPCKTFAGAISHTAKDGEISVLDPGGYGVVTITKSITINGTNGAGYASVLASLTTGVIINITDPTDLRRTVRLIALDINGVGSGLGGVRILSTNLAGSSVVIENSRIDGFTGRGISDERTNGGKLVVSDTTVRHTADSGIRIAAGQMNRIDATLTNVRVHNSAVAALTVNGGAKAMVSNSVFSGSNIGLDVEQDGTSATVDGSTVNGNTTGIFTNAGAVLRLSNSNVSFNATGVSGTVSSYSNNRFAENGGAGTTTPIGAATSATGQQ